MNAEELFKKECIESGFDIEKDQELLERIWQGIIKITLTDLAKERIGNLDTYEAIKANHLCQKFNIVIKPMYLTCKQIDNINEKREYSMSKVVSK